MSNPLSNIQAAILNCASLAYHNGGGDLLDVDIAIGDRGDQLADFIICEIIDATALQSGSAAVQSAYDAIRKAAFELNDVALAIDKLGDDLGLK